MRASWTFRRLPGKSTYPRLVLALNKYRTCYYCQVQGSGTALTLHIGIGLLEKLEPLIVFLVKPGATLTCPMQRAGPYPALTLSNAHQVSLELVQTGCVGNVVDVDMSCASASLLVQSTVLRALLRSHPPFGITMRSIYSWHLHSLMCRNTSLHFISTTRLESNLPFQSKYLPRVAFCRCKFEMRTSHPLLPDKER